MLSIFNILIKTDCELDGLESFGWIHDPESQNTIKIENFTKFEILVENPGRVNFSVLDDERKGLLCSPTTEGF